jgi:hypothetical protein
MRRRSLLAALLALLAVALVPAAAGADSKPKVAFGAYVPEVTEKPQRLDRVARLVGRTAVIASIYKQWDTQPFVHHELDEIWRRGAVPMITWEPFSYHGEDFPLRLIQRGHFDQYVIQAAIAARRWKHPILLRFAHEMNGDWYPWGRGVEGNNSYRYRAVWRRLVQIFRRRGADNVQWVWTPNANAGGDFPFRDLYPGDRWVDWVGFDAFNWALRGEWNSFTDLIDNTYEELAKLTDRPMIVAETGSSESGGDKAEWVNSALRREIPKLSRIRAVVFFDDQFEDQVDGESRPVDSRFDSSPETLRAFRSAIEAPAWGLDRAMLLATPRRYDRGPTAAPAPPSDGYGRPSLLYRLFKKLHGKYIAYAAGLALLGLVALIGVILLLRRLLRRRALAARQAH